MEKRKLNKGNIKMKKLSIALACLTLTACGSAVEIPPAHVGKILTKNGYAPETLPPSKFRLEPCAAYCDRLVLLETSDQGFREPLQVFMPKDKLNIQVDVRGTFSIPSSKSITDAIFDRVVSQESTGSSSVISGQKVYKIYGQQAIRGIVRSELVKHNISDVLSQREAISNNIHAAIVKKLNDTNTPIKLSRFELANIQPPEIIVKAQESAKEREIDIQKAEAEAQVQLVTAERNREIAIKRAEAQAQVDLVKAERDLEIAKKNRLVEREKALAIAEQNKIAAKSITPQLLAYKKLETAENIYKALANSHNVVIVPADSSGFSNINDSAAFSKLLGKELRK